MSFQIKTQLAAYKVLITAVKAGASPSVFDSAVRSFEPLFLGNLVLVLEEMFVHRSRGIEQFKDGNPLNEVRMLCNSILLNRSVMAADKTIKYDSSKSVFKIPVGEKIQLTEASFVRLVPAFFAEIEARFS